MEPTSEKRNSLILSLKKTIVQYSVKKHVLNRDWSEEENVIDSNRKNIKLRSTTKKSVKFSNKVEEIPNIEICPNTPDKPILTNEKKLRSCKERLKTPYSKESSVGEKSVNKENMAECNIDEEGGDSDNGKDSIGSKKRSLQNENFAFNEDVLQFISSCSKKKENHIETDEKVKDKEKNLVKDEKEQENKDEGCDESADKVKDKEINKKVIGEETKEIEEEESNEEEGDIEDKENSPRIINK